MTFAVEAILLLSLLKFFLSLFFITLPSLIVIELYNGFIPSSHKNSLIYESVSALKLSVFIVEVLYAAIVSFSLLYRF